MKTYPPTGAQLRQYMERHGLTSRQVGALVQLEDKDARMVRHWMNERHQMPFTAWFTLRAKVLHSEIVSAEKALERCGGADAELKARLAELRSEQGDLYEHEAVAVFAPDEADPSERVYLVDGTEFTQKPNHT